MLAVLAVLAVIAVLALAVVLFVVLPLVVMAFVGLARADTKEPLRDEVLKSVCGRQRWRDSESARIPAGHTGIPDARGSEAARADMKQNETLMMRRESHRATGEVRD